MAVLVCYVANFMTCSIRKRMTAEKVVLEMLSILSTLYEVSSDNLELSCMTLCVKCGSTNTGPEPEYVLKVENAVPCT